MPRKTLSNMTDQDFVRALAALGLRHRDLGGELSRALGRQRAVSQSSISAYATGRNPIPLDIADGMHKLVAEKAAKLQVVAASRDLQVSRLIEYHNQRRRSNPDAPHMTAGRFMNRQRPEGTDPKLLAPYRIRLKYYPVLVQALAGWHAHVRTLARTYTDQARQRDYQLEITDLKALASSLPRSLPYEAHVTKAEWQVIGRALRHDGTNPAINLYQHWKRHKGCGYPVRRPAPADEISSRGESA